MSTRFEAVNSERAGLDGLLGTNATLAGRFRINSLPSAGNYSAIVTRTIAFTGWSILVDDAGHLRIQLLNSAVLSAAGPTALALNTWYYLWIRQVASAPGTVFIYLDGNAAPELTSATDFFNPAARLEFATAISGGTPRFLDCSLCGWKVWSSNLAASNATIEDGSHKATTIANLLAEYFFEGTDVTDHSGNGNDLIAVGVLSAGPDSPIDGLALTATQLALTTQPSSTATTGVVFPQQPVVQVRDAANALVNTSIVTVTASIASGTGVLSGTTVVEAVAGVAVFTDLKITGVSTDAIIFTSAGLTSVTSSPIDVIVAPATKLTIIAQPSTNASSAVPFNTQPVIQVQTAAGALVSSSANVTASIESGSGVLSGTTTVAAVNGVATFTNLVITGASVDTIRFTSTGLTPATSGTITVVVPVATKLGVAVQPAGAENAVVFTTQPVIQVQDATGAPFPNTAIITAAIATGTGVLSGTVAVAAIAGVATFADLIITGTGVHTIVFTSPGLTSITSADLFVSSGLESIGQLTATPKNSLGVTIPDQVITYNSSNPAVATVNSTGLVSAVSPGTSRVSAFCNGVQSNRCNVTVI